ncbi:TPA: hypothetical protein ACPJZU_004734 [Vibrio alginolyticus]
MSINKVSNQLPNTSNDSSGSNVFLQYLNAKSVAVNSSDAVTHYQCLKDNGYTVRDSELNFCLEVKSGCLSSQSISEGEDIYGKVSGLDYQSLLDDLDGEFKKQCYRFSANSTVFKGITLYKPYYKKFEPCKLKPGDIIDIHTFFSTTVSRDRALNYGSVLLVISGLDKVDCIVPPIATIPNSGDITDEQEVLLNRGFRLEVTRVHTNEIHVMVV